MTAGHKDWDSEARQAWYNLRGLYQVNVIVPDGVAPGNEVSLVLAQDGVPSNTVALAIQ